ncbi:hypothetical protein FNV43_RR11968 [Rhamnella rubrinervis]|uniref:Uncharacterized protein n=1 Tax=Rhamnella rubrinervis TaxID=2594499 RepID=A0A8K0H7F2_9ROSA|nr:hypothetical protein FNV43_RR11968 [Rhamnella rubrinervis]
MATFVGFLILLLITLEVAADLESPQVFYDWTVSYSRRAPLGVEKQVIVINDEFPGPLLNASTNDIVHVNIHNNLMEPFLMTWNGIHVRRNSWQDGAQETNCPIMPGQSWTYTFQLKDQIGSFFYFPSLLLQKGGGGYGAITVNNRDVLLLPFNQPYQDLNMLLADWYNAHHWDLRRLLDEGHSLRNPDGILINGLGPYDANFVFEPGQTYRLRISNVGLKTSINLRIEDHQLLLVETEGSYTIKQYYTSLDIHVGQSYSVLVTAKSHSQGGSFYMVASSRFTFPEITGVAVIRYTDSLGEHMGPLPQGPSLFDYSFSLDQARSIRWDLSVGAARENPQGSFHYGNIKISRMIYLENGVMTNQNKLRYTINGVSFVHPDTPLKLADYFQINHVFTPGIIPDMPDQTRMPTLGTSVIDALYRDFVHVVLYNPLSQLQSWHLDGYSFFVVGMEQGNWNPSKMATYNMVDAVSRSTVQVYPSSWTAILIKLDNQGMWNLRSQNAENWYLGQELYIRVKGVGQDDPLTIPTNDEAPIPDNVIKCGRALLHFLP